MDPLVGLVSEIVGLGMTQWVCKWYSGFISGLFGWFRD